MMSNNEKKDILVMQHNIAHRIHVHDILMAWLQTEKKEWIVCLQEPFMSKKGLPRLPRQYCAFWSTTTHGGVSRVRSAILAPKTLCGYLVNQHSDIDCTTVRFDSLSTSIISLYCAGNLCIENSFRLLKLEREGRKNVVVCADTNAYHYAWGSVLRNDVKKGKKERGVEIMTIINELDMDACNVLPHAPTYVGDARGGESHIDATFCTNSNMNLIDEWVVHTDPKLSDHRCITFRYGTSGSLCDIKQVKATAPWRKPSKKMEKVMYEMLQKRVHYFRRINTVSDVTGFISRHTAQVSSVLHDVFCKKGREKKKEVFWWTDTVSKAHKKMKLALRRKIRYGHENLIVEYKQRRCDFRMAVDSAKLEAWRDFTSDISDPWEGLMKIVRATDTGRSLSKTLADLQGVYASDLKQTLVILGSQFYPAPCPLLLCHISIENEVNNRLKKVCAGKKLTICEFRDALSNMSNATAPGMDGITNNVIKFLATKCKYEQQYMKMFDFCLQRSFFPEDWKKARIVLIPKASTLLDNVKSLRPISLTSSFAKLFERVVLARMNHHLEMSGKLSSQQHAYRKGSSTNSALYEVFEFVDRAMCRKQACVVVFLDISGAFDRTWHHGILSKLLKYDVPEYLVAWVREFLKGRTALFVDGSETHEVSLQQGCPQGGVLSPILWNVLFDEMLQLTYDGNIENDVCLKSVGYADDAAIICRASTVECASKILTKHLKKVSAWADNNRVVFNSSKLAAMSISSQRTTSTPTEVFFNGTLVADVDRYKYLGVTVDSKLTWKPHIDNVLQKLAGITKSLRGVARQGWGVKLHIMRLLYNAIFVPVLMYGAVVWGWRACFKCICIKFDKEIRAFALMATRCMKTTSNEVLFRLLHTLPFQHLLRNEVLKVSVQQFGIVTSDREKVYDTYSARVKREAPKGIGHYMYMCRRELDKRAQQVECDDVKRYYNVHPANRVITNVCIENKVSARWKGAQSVGWRIYTDASTTSYASGWAFAAFKNGFCLSTDFASLSRCSAYTAEAYAILQAVVFARRLKNLSTHEIVEIRTDAQSVVQALSTLVQTDQLLGAIKDNLTAAAHEGKNIKFRWIPSHDDIQGNEFVDRLAKRAVDSKNVTVMSVAMRDVKSMIKERETRVGVREWGKIESRIPKLFFPRSNSFRAFTKAMPSIALCQLVSGHSRLNDFVFRKLGVISSPKCECKKADETVFHYLFECAKYDDLREEIWPDLEPSYEFVTRDWKKLDKFVHRSGRFKLTTTPQQLRDIEHD